MAGDGAEEMAGHGPPVINGPAFFGCTGGNFKSNWSSGDVSNAVNSGKATQGKRTGPSHKQRSEDQQESQAFNRRHDSGVTTENGKGHSEQAGQEVEAEVDTYKQSFLADLNPNTSEAPGFTGRQALSKVPAGTFSPPFVSSPRQFASEEIKVHVSNLPPSMTGKQLRTLFEPFGQVQEYILIRDDNRGASTGFGFIEYSRAEEAEEATCCLDGHVIDGKKLVVEVASRRGRPPSRPSRSPPSPLAARQKGPPGLTGYAATSPLRTARGANDDSFTRQPLQESPAAGASMAPWIQAPHPQGAPLLNAPSDAQPPHHGAVGSASKRPPLYGGFSRAGELPHQYGAPFPEVRAPPQYYGASGVQQPPFHAALPVDDRQAPQDYGAPDSGAQPPPFHGPPPPERHFAPPDHGAPFTGGQHPPFAYPSPPYGAPPLAIGGAPATDSYPQVKEVAEGGGSTRTPAASLHDSDAHLSAACESQMSVYKVVRRPSESEASCDVATVEATAARLARTHLEKDLKAGQVQQQISGQQIGHPAQRDFMRRSRSLPPAGAVPAYVEQPAAAACCSEPPAAAASDGMGSATSGEDGPEAPPTLTALYFEGRLACGEELVGTYTYAGGEEGDTRMAWYMHEDEDDLGTVIPESVGERRLMLTYDHVGWFISFRCMPVRADGAKGRTEEAMGKHEVKPYPLQIAGLSLTGSPIEGAVLTAELERPEDPEAQENWGDFLDYTSYKWYRSKPDDHSSFTPLPDATECEYRLSHEDVGCIMRCEVRARDVFGSVSRAAYAVSATVERAPSSLRDQRLKRRAGLEEMQGRGQTRLNAQPAPSNPSYQNPQLEPSCSRLRRGSKLLKRARDEDSGDDELSAKRANQERSKDRSGKDRMDHRAGSRGTAGAAEESDNEGNSDKSLGSKKSAALATNDCNDDDTSGQDDGDRSAAHENSTGGSVREGTGKLPESETSREERHCIMEEEVTEEAARQLATST